MRPGDQIEIFGIVNLTTDSFSDGGRFLEAEAALAHARALLRGGAGTLDLGAASSHPDAESVSAEEEIARLRPVLDALLPERDQGFRISIDSCQPAVQSYALERDVDYINDIRGFAVPDFYEVLAAARARLVVMFSVLGDTRAARTSTAPDRIFEVICDFFDTRLAALLEAGIARERLILDPGMGFFLGTDPRCSLEVLRRLPELRTRYGLPLLISVSRKSFLGTITGRGVAERGAATLAAELFAVAQGAAFIRTHDAAALRDALLVTRALRDS